MQIITNKEEWNRILEDKFTQFNDIYFRYEYLELWGKHYGGDPEAIFWEDNNIKIFWSHLVRDTNIINLTLDFNSELFDLTSPYAYGCQIFSPKTEDEKKVKESLKLFFGDYAKKNNHKSEFIRFHPIFKMWKHFYDTKFFNIQHINDVVVIDLTKDISTLFGNIKKGHRYNIGKSIERGCTVAFETNPQKAQIDNFITLYTKTMDRNRAVERYYFTTEFISDHFELLNALLVEAKIDNTVIGSSIFLLGKEIIHYHLSGSDYDFRSYYPSDLILSETIKWAQEHNFKMLHLGGGHGKDDSLFKFKKGFSNTTLPFYIGKRGVCK